LNLDVSANGREFHAAGSASLWEFIRDVAASTRQPGDTMSVSSAWVEKERGGDDAKPRIGDLGGGSDFAGFYNVLGIPSFEFGFRGRYGAYHSAYDTFNWMEKFGDPGFLSHAAAARMAAIALTRLAGADLLPFDFEEFGHALGQAVATRRQQATDLGLVTANWSRVDSAVARLTLAGTEMNGNVAFLGNYHGYPVPGPAALTAANDSLRLAEQAFARSEGIPGRPLYRNVLFAPGRDDGYGSVALPGLESTIVDGDEVALVVEVRDLAARANRAAELVEGAVAVLRLPPR
jgi:N-acetylated-alpha-linked acidic dipeptidase